MGFEIDNTVLQNTGQIVRQPVDGDYVQHCDFAPDVLSGLRSGFRALLELASMENQRSTWLAIDGSERPEIQMLVSNDFN